MRQTTGRSSTRKIFRLFLGLLVHLHVTIGLQSATYLTIHTTVLIGLRLRRWVSRRGRRSEISPCFFKIIGLLFHWFLGVLGFFLRRYSIGTVPTSRSLLILFLKRRTLFHFDFLLLELLLLLLLLMIIVEGGMVGVGESSRGEGRGGRRYRGYGFTQVFR